MNVRLLLDGLSDADEIPVCLVRKCLYYDSSTGLLLWKHRGEELFQSGRRSAAQRAAIWNGRFAGVEAFNCIDGGGYKFGRLFYRYLRAHRVAWAIYHGAWPSKGIDHINGDRSDNRIWNLRNVSVAENNKNRKIGSVNQSGCMGVSLKRSTGRWGASISVNSKHKHLGYFADKADAIRARQDAEVKYGYHKNHGRRADG